MKILTAIILASLLGASAARSSEMPQINTEMQISSANHALAIRHLNRHIRLNVRVNVAQR
jgi:hypothetical protein